MVRYDVTNEDKYLSFVLSQYKKTNNLGYTLSCYCTENFELGHPEGSLPVCRQLKGSWKLRDNSSPEGGAQKRFSLEIGTAGGPPGKGSFGSNPQWSIMLPPDGVRMQVKCMAPKEVAVNVILARSKPGRASQHGELNEQKSRRIHHLYEDPAIDTGSYRHGFAVSDVVYVPGGLYTLVASTFEVGQVANFLLHVLSSSGGVRVSELE